MMKKALQPFLRQFSVETLNHTRSRTFFQQPLLCFASGFTRKPTEGADSSDVGELEENNSQDSLEMPMQVKESTKIIHRKLIVEGDAPLRKILASTNKMLFGPLLETSQEKKRRLKREALGTEEKDRPKKRKRKQKKAPELGFQPIIQNPENSHFLNIDSSTELINFDKENTSEGTASFTLPYNKRRVVLSSPGDLVNNYQGTIENLSIPNRNSENTPISYIKRKKIIILSRSESYEKDASSSNIENETASKKTSQLTSNEHAECFVPFSDVRGHQSMTNDSRSETTSFLTIDNSHFTAAPNSLNISEMENFPLFSNILHRNLESHQDLEKSRDDIISIGMFDGGYPKLPSVRKILDGTMPDSNRIALERWKVKMIKKLGDEGFNQYREGLLNRGKQLHHCIQSELSGVPVHDEHVLPFKELWMSIKPVLPSVSDVKVLESRLIHPYLYYQGAVDCIASYRGMPMLIEWKTSTKPKLSVRSMFDDPLQVVAYLGALNFDGNYRFSHPIESAMLVVAYESGLPAHVHVLKKDDCQVYWRTWCSRLCQFWRLQKPKTLVET